MTAPSTPLCNASQSVVEAPFLWFDRGPVTEIDSDFSEDESEDYPKINIHSRTVAPSLPSRYGSLGSNDDIEVLTPVRKTSVSDKSSTSEAHSASSRDAYALSRTSQASIGFHMDNT